MAKRSEVGYVSDTGKAMAREPEAVSAAEQRGITERARRAERKRKLTGWREARQMLLDGVEAAQAALGAPYRGDLRNVGRAVARIDAKLRG